MMSIWGQTFNQASDAGPNVYRGLSARTRMHECGASPHRILEKSPTFPDLGTTALAVDDHYVYWGQGTAVIYRFPK